MVCSDPPEGCYRWTLDLIVDETHRRELVEGPISREQVRIILQEHDLKPLLHGAIGQTEDGSLISTEGRVLMIAMPDGEHRLRFPRGWGEAQLRAVVEARGLSGGRLVAAHVPAPVKSRFSRLAAMGSSWWLSVVCVNRFGTRP